MQLGGQAELGFGGIPNPTARQALRFYLRREDEVEGRRGDLLNPAEGINIVEIPDEADVNAFNQLFEFSSDEEGGEYDSNSPRRSHSAGEVDPNSGLTHDPTNGGDTEHDQTGTHLARYSTIMVPVQPAPGQTQRQVTVDRSPAHAGTEEKWKLWKINKNGEWKCT